MLFQLIGYRQTGKDALYKNLDCLKPLGWQVYGLHDFTLPTANTCRIAFADKLKTIVCKELGMHEIDNPSTVYEKIIPTYSISIQEWIANGWIDIIKDLPPNEVNLPLGGKTFRSWLIDYALEMKAKYSDNYFVDLVAKDVNNKLEQGINVFITDTRYPYEVLNNATTIRLFRSDVPIPVDQSETSMDHYKCSYVFCKNDDDFEILCTLQPQYSDYKFIRKL